MLRKFAGIAVVIGLSSLLFSAMLTQPTSAAAPDDKCKTQRILTFPTWYRGITSGQQCNIVSPSDLGGNTTTQLSRYIWIIALNVLEIMIQLVAYLAAAFLIWGGFIYITSNGSPDGITRGRKMILNAVIGLVLSLFAVIAVSYVVGSIT